MLERIKKMEAVLKLGGKSSTAYESIVDEANTIRLLYASYHLKRRNSLLPTIRQKLIIMKKREREILNKFVKKVEGKLEK